MNAKSSDVFCWGSEQNRKKKKTTYEIVDGYCHGSWPGANNEKIKHCSQRILWDFPFDINL
ncbi:hypothetical protein VCRA2119O48_110083 [Vibrio crassostreae]|nr:hypothetical protein VCRA2119O48_110083 [Vibrio crassostreae]CAK3906181.1 hypothetical protein VCRA212O16_330023 [Vibrio crassostreae]